MGLIETAEAMLVEDDIVGLTCQFRENVGVPGVANQDATLGAVWACIVSPTLNRRCRTRFGESAGPMSERSGRKPIFRQMIGMPI